MLSSRGRTNCLRGHFIICAKGFSIYIEEFYNIWRKLSISFHIDLMEVVRLAQTAFIWVEESL